MRLNAHGQSILVTARPDEQEIIKECLSQGIKILPKSLANEIEISSPKELKKAVLIDDDKLTHLSWKIAAKKSSIDLHSYLSVDEFLHEANEFNIDVPIYVDSDLGNNLKGQVLSEKIYSMGFSEI